MPRNGSGLYTLPYNWNDDKANGIKVLASRMQNQDQDIANALTGSVAADGQTSITGDLDFNGNRAVDLGDGQDTQDAVVIGQVQTGELQYYGVSSTIPLGTPGRDYEVNSNPSLLEYVDGLNFSFVADIDCIDDPVLRVDTLAQLDMVKDDGSGGYVPLVAGDLIADHVYQAFYHQTIGVDKLVINNPQKAILGISNLTVSKTIAANVFSKKSVSISNNALDANNDIDFIAGSAFDVVNNLGFFLGTNLVKKLDASWSAGTNQGGLDTGTKANDTWYYCYTIYNPTTNIADAIFSTNSSSPTLPSGYVNYDYVGAIRTDSSGNIYNGSFKFSFDGSYTFMFNLPIASYNSSPPATSKTLVTVTCPPNSTAFLYHSVTTVSPGTSRFFRVFADSATDAAPTVNNCTLNVGVSGAGVSALDGGCPVSVNVNSSSQVAYRADAANGSFNINTFGFSES